MNRICLNFTAVGKKLVNLKFLSIMAIKNVEVNKMTEKKNTSGT